MSLWATVLLSSMLLAAPVASVSQEGVVGDWIGTFALAGRQTVIRVTLKTEGNGLAGTLALPLEDSGAGDAGLPLGKASVESARLRFEVQLGPALLAFDGVVKDGVIRGTVRQAQSEGSFELARTTPLDPGALARHAGAYALEPSGTLYLFVFAEMGQLAYVEQETGRVGLLYPQSESRFFAGPSLMLPTPVESWLTLDGTRSLRWQHGSGPARTGQRIPLAEEPVRFRNGAVELSGTLILPATKGPHPAAVVTHGSGPVSRESLRLSAFHLARHGIAALVYDKRGVGESKGDWKEASFDDLAGDALAGLQLLKGRPDIDPRRIGLTGGSQGGWIAPLAASRSSDVAFVLVVSAPAVTPGEQGLMARENELRAEGLPEDEIKDALALQRLSDDVTRTGKGWAELEARCRKLAGKSWAAEPPVPVDHWYRRFYRRILDHDPIPVLGKVACPVFAIYGELDTLVPVDRNKDKLEAALKKGGNRDVTIRVFPRGDHNLFEVESGAPTELLRTKGFVAGYLDAITDWLGKRVSAAR